MLQRFLDPSALAVISSLDLVAKTVVEGFTAGLHRSPDFGFSQEFAEYRAYNPGDDLRHVDWNVFARTERMYLKRYRGETNTRMMVMLDTSASMTYSSRGVSKLDYARYLAASLVYLANLQRDAAGVLLFSDDIQTFVPPSSRQGQTARLLHAINEATPGTRTGFAKPFEHFRNLNWKRGVVILISDFYEQPETILTNAETLRFRGSEVILFHVLDPWEIAPNFTGPLVLRDLEDASEMEVSADFARQGYRLKIDSHVTALRDGARSRGLDYFLLDTARPLDAALREYLSIRTARL